MEKKLVQLPEDAVATASLLNTPSLVILQICAMSGLMLAVGRNMG